MFDSVLADNAKTNVYSLKAVVTYYGKHYSTVCYHSSHQEWVYFDDTIVRTVSGHIDTPIVNTSLTSHLPTPHTPHTQFTDWFKLVRREEPVL